MKKAFIAILFITFVLLIVVANSHILRTNFENIQYPRYREGYAYNLKNPLLERYKSLAIDNPVGDFEE